MRTPNTDMVRRTHAEMLSEGERRFGPDRMTWRFVCPSCGHVATPQDWKDAGAEETEVGFSCVGRHLGATGAFDRTKYKPCNYTSGGFFCINTAIVVMGDGKEVPVFDFAGAP